MEAHERAGFAVDLDLDRERREAVVGRTAIAVRDRRDRFRSPRAGPPRTRAPRPARPSSSLSGERRSRLPGACAASAPPSSRRAPATCVTRLAPAPGSAAASSRYFPAARRRAPASTTSVRRNNALHDREAAGALIGHADDGRDARRPRSAEAQDVLPPPVCAADERDSPRASGRHRCRPFSRLSAFEHRPYPSGTGAAPRRSASCPATDHVEHRADSSGSRPQRLAISSTCCSQAKKVCTSVGRAHVPAGSAFV